MPNFESHPNEGPEPLIVEALHSRPPIPVDIADISESLAQTAGDKATEPGWAWTRLPLWLAEIESTYDNIGDTPIITLDICSSVPMYAQRLRCLEFDRDGARARDLINELFSGQTMARLSHENPEFRPITHALARHKLGRRLLEAGIQESLYEITSDEAAGKNATNPNYRLRLREKLAAQSRAYTHNHEIVDGADAQRRGFRIDSTDYDLSYLEHLSSLKVPLENDATRQAKQRLAGPDGTNEDKAIASQKQRVGLELAEQYLDWQAGFVADTVVGSRRYRPARFFSMDKANPENIAVSALANMPAAALTLDGFSHAVASLSRPLQHLRANLFNSLPFPDNSLALITCFDGWPFHFQADPELHAPDQDFGQITADVLHNLYQKLAYGGKIVIFPWAMKGDSYATSKGGSRALTDIAAAFGGAVDEQFNMKGIHRNTLLKYMSSADRETSLRISPIFEAPDDYFFALVIAKSKESSLKALRAKSHLGNLAVTTQAQD